MSQLGFEDEVASGDAQGKYNLINSYLLKAGVATSGQCATDLERLTKIAEGYADAVQLRFRKLNERLSVFIRRADSDNSTIQMLRQQLKEAEREVEKQERQTKELQRSLDCIQNKLDQVVLFSRKRQEKLQQEKDEIARQLNNSRRLQAASTSEFKRKSASFLSAQEAVDKLSGRGITYRNEFSLLKLLPKSGLERVGYSMGDVQAYIIDQREEEQKKLAAYESAFHQLSDSCKMFPQMEFLRQNKLSWGSMPAQLLGSGLSRFLQEFEQILINRLQNAGMQTSLNVVARGGLDLQEGYKMLAECQTNMLGRVIERTVAQNNYILQPTINARTLTEGLQHAAATSNKQEIIDLCKLSEEYLQHTKSTFVGCSETLSCNAQLQTDTLERLKIAANRYRQLASQLHLSNHKFQATISAPPPQRIESE